MLSSCARFSISLRARNSVFYTSSSMPAGRPIKTCSMRGIVSCAFSPSTSRYKWYLSPAKLEELAMFQNVFDDRLCTAPGHMRCREAGRQSRPPNRNHYRACAQTCDFVAKKLVGDLSHDPDPSPVLASASIGSSMCHIADRSQPKM